MSLVLPHDFVLPIAGALEIIAARPYIAIGFKIKDEQLSTGWL